MKKKCMLSLENKDTVWLKKWFENDLKVKKRIQHWIHTKNMFMLMVRKVVLSSQIWEEDVWTRQQPQTYSQNISEKNDIFDISKT